MKRITVWALFDSGNGCYTKAVNKFFDNIDIYPVGVDIENKNNHFTNLNLADYSELFNVGGNSKMFEELDKLPPPDIILASPPCESWSTASGMPRGNVCWQTLEIRTLFGVEKADNNFTIRTRSEIEEDNIKKRFFKKHWWKTVFNRINGELCAFNTMRIIERYKPKIWVIENPLGSRIWKYYEQIQNFHGIRNTAYYNAYDEDFPKKPTMFYSNKFFNLKKTWDIAKVVIGRKKGDTRPLVEGYNKRSNIPETLIKEILEKCIKMIEGDK